MLEFVILLSIFGSMANGADDSSWCPAIKNPDVKTYEITFKQAQLFPLKYFYLCQQFTINDDKEYHVIAWEPIVDNDPIVDHITIFTCDAAGERRLKTMRNFTQPQICDVDPRECPDIGLLWNFDQSKRCYSEDAGLPAGKNAFRTGLLQVLYENDNGTMANMTDSSGIRFYITDKKRPNDIALIGLGQLDVVIPPKTKAAKVRARIFNGDNCSREALAPYNRYFINTVSFEVNDLATNVKLTIQKANGTNIVLFDKPVVEGHPLTAAWTKADAAIIEPGDNCEVECTYDSSKRDKFTYFGEQMDDELCLAFVEIYPRPHNKSFIEIFNIDDMNICLWVGDPDGPSQLQNCTDVRALSNALMDILNSTESSDFMRYCYSKDIPATACTKNCYLLLQRHKLLGNPCMMGSVFRYFGSFLYSPIYSDIFHIQAQTDKCHTLKDISQTIG